jgi:hypothetical protein
VSPAPRVEIATLPDGRGTLLLDGIDLSRYIRAFDISGEAHGGTTITLHLRAGLSLDFTADPAVELVRTFLVAQRDCLCEEVLPILGSHEGGLKVDPQCPQHGEGINPSPTDSL